MRPHVSKNAVGETPAGPTSPKRGQTTAGAIVCKLKGIGYDSTYDPMADPAIIAERNSLAEIDGGLKGLQS